MSQFLLQQHKYNSLPTPTPNNTQKKAKQIRNKKEIILLEDVL